MPRPLKTALLLLCFALPLAACADRTQPPVPPVVVRKELVPQPIPGDLLACAPQPAAPGSSATQRDVGQFILDLAAAGADCRWKVGAVGEIVKATTAAKADK